MKLDWWVVDACLQGLAPGAPSQLLNFSHLPTTPPKKSDALFALSLLARYSPRDRESAAELVL